MFKYVFDEQSTQTDLFESLGLPLVEDLLQGKNGKLVQLRYYMCVHVCVTLQLDR